MTHNSHGDLVNMTKHGVDAVAAGAVGFTFLDKLPEIAAGFAILWYITRLVEWGISLYNRYKGGDNEK